MQNMLAPVMKASSAAATGRVVEVAIPRSEEYVPPPQASSSAGLSKR